MNARMFLCALAAVAAPAAAAQQPPATPPAIPIYKVAPAEATTKELIGIPAGLKQFADGRLIVNDILKQRLLVFDKNLATFKVTADSGGTGATLYPRSFSMSSIYYYPGDSAMFPDLSNMMAGSFIMINPDGTFGRAVAHPRPRDLSLISAPYSGSPSFDAQGRFVYRAQNGFLPRPKPGDPPAPVKTVDTVAIVRADFETRKIDTITHVFLPAQSFPSPVTYDDKGHPSAKRTINPVPVSADEWVVLSDGSVAVVRAHDYHIDWVYADGKEASTPKMPFDWRRLTDQDKQAKIDSVKHVIDSLSKTPRGYGMIITGGRAGQVKPDTVFPTIEFAPYSEMLDYVPPIRQGSVKADRDNHVWIVPTTTLSATGGGLLYDVINMQGEIFERVQLPPGRVIAGFGPGGVIYLMSGDRDKGFTIERTRVVRPTKGAH